MPRTGHADCRSVRGRRGDVGAVRIDAYTRTKGGGMAENPSGEVVRVAAVGDVHCAKDSSGKLKPLFEQVAERADVLVLCGDLTDYGLVEEAQLLVKEIPTGMRTPIIAVLGNHDYESGQQAEVRQVFVDAGMIMLDGESCVVAGVGFAGVKG